MGTFFLENFGCRTTQAEGAAIASELLRRGYQLAARDRAAWVILNTCTVTSAADEDIRQAVHRIRRENPTARIVLAGCYAQRAPSEAATIPGVACVVGNSHKDRIAELIADLESEEFSHCRIFVGEVEQARHFVAADTEFAAGDRTRPVLKIQDGCSFHCSFCIIPTVRGRSRSAPPEWVVEQVRRLSMRYREVVLSGINLGRWGRDLPGRMRLADLLRRLLEETDVERLRLSSVEPMDLSDELLRLVAGSGRIARHIHAPLQSGADSVLRRMRRWYRVRHYEDRILRAHAWIPDAAIGADVMVGFPGETEEEFAQTVRLVERLPFTYLHVFAFSPRPGTPAAQWPDQVPVKVRKERSRILRELAARKNLEFRQRMVGHRLSVLTLEDRSLALSSNYLKVELAQPREPNRIVEVEIGDITETGLRERRTTPSTGA
ncbi:MAG: tRNA (N(6)-L-threonylcarbamoyladenosine(37)-C(2))-methylthiotransferase MtaB [Bryobacterales bacterium]|nr:tRNA (N(6)-L-threonylcarbamoyladenosine(37)-C(2))-methylthiotransferase MtaB [Bryobacterales bacterium]